MTDKMCKCEIKVIKCNMDKVNNTYLLQNYEHPFKPYITSMHFKLSDKASPRNEAYGLIQNVICQGDIYFCL